MAKFKKFDPNNKKANRKKNASKWGLREHKIRELGKSSLAKFTAWKQKIYDTENI